MTKLIMQKQCGCFRKSDLKAEQTFETKEEAHEEAVKMCEFMNEKFCQKHNFSIEDNGDEIVIKVELN